MLEIEVKILDIDTRAVENRLLELGAQKVFDGKVCTVFYDFPDGRLSREDKTLRLRTKGSVAEFTFKRKLSTEGAKIAYEQEVCVSNYETMRTILRRLGFQELSGVEKTRTSYVLGAVHVDIDTLPGIPTFLEVEAPDQSTLESIVVLLGFTMRDAKPWTGKEVRDHYNRQKPYGPSGTVRE